MKNLFLISIFIGLFVSSFSWAQKTEKTYGVILNGGGDEINNKYRYYQNVKQLHDAYIQSGLSKKDIYTLFASGNNTDLDTQKRETMTKDIIKYVDAESRLAQDPNSVIKKDVKTIPEMMFNASSSFKADGIVVNGSASKQDFKKAFTEIAKKAKPGDLINIFITDHGTPEGEVVMWSKRDKLATTKTMNVDEIKEILEVIPKGVHIQIANNICYGGKLLELTDPDRGICVTSLEGPNKFVTSGYEKSDYIELYSQNLKIKNFYDSYLNAKNNDFLDNIGSWNSLDYFINNEIKKGISSPIEKTQVSRTMDPLTCPMPNTVITESDDILKQSQLQVVTFRLNQTKNDLNTARKMNKQYRDDIFEKKSDLIKEKYQEIHKMKSGKDKVNLYAARVIEQEALRCEKNTYAQRIVNLEVTLKSLEKELQFLKTASFEQRAKYSKIKNCLERSL